jgi:hypothetical protein
MKTVLLDLISYIQFAHPTQLIAELDTWFESIDDSDRVLAFLLYEFLPEHDGTIACLTYLRKKNVTVILDDQYRAFNHQWDGLDIVYIHYWPLYVKTLINSEKLPWNPKSKKALMLTGKMHYLNRVGALASAYKSKAIKKIIFSFMYTLPEFNEQCRDIVKLWGVDHKELLGYCLDNRSSIDLEHMGEIPSTRDGSKDFEFYVEIVNTSVYEQTKVSIVSETFSKSTFAVTEKVWKAVMCGHPYILMATPGTTMYLTSIGIKNINHLLPRNINGDISSRADIDAALENAVWFLENSKHDDEVLDIIDHNYKQYLHLAEDATTTVNKIAEKVNVPDLLANLMNRKTIGTVKLRKHLVTKFVEVETKIKKQMWAQFYKSIMGDEWPQDPPEIDNLPMLVQEELKQMKVDINCYRPNIHPMSETFLLS